MDRRTVWAILLMMVIAITPAIFIKRPPRPVTGAGSTADSTAGAPAAAPGSVGPAAVAAPGDTAARGAASADTLRAPADTTAAAAAPVRTVRATSSLYRYGISTSGARLVEARLPHYRSIAPADSGATAQLLPPDSRLLGLTLVMGRDTIPLEGWTFTASTDSLDAAAGEPLRLTATRGAVGVDLEYRFAPDDYRIAVTGRVSGVGPNGGTLLVGMGPTLANTEANIEENHHALAVVTRRDDAERIDLGSLKPGETRTVSGPLDWVAMKSKYFVTGVLAYDSTGGRIGGAAITARPTTEKRPTEADVRLSVPLPPGGEFSYTTYVGPMEYDRLGRLGRGFDDVNPYGWPGFRTIIRPVAVGVRWLLVWMHQHLHLAYGLVLVSFGIMVRLLLWPLNQKAMRANMQLQAVQPLMKDIQERHKNDPQKMQQEMFKLYKEYNVNPLGGCWPMLLPMPVLFALFFVFQNTIELRGASFLWLPDLSRPDPLYIIPVIMGASMWGLSKVGQVGMEPNPQMKMMLYIMPVMMTFLFLNFASGLNLYYAVSNIASIPQQWLLARERLRKNTGAVVSTKPPAAGAGKAKKKA
ncbi:MAG TPA: membrane protein insertase YidC [Gemmatimonadales bacterium]|nr:membrane protein insertase YidC [Gemmatimonadales bacterium]